jgi:hypothetical protein
MNNAGSPEPVPEPVVETPGNPKPARTAILFQVIALVLACVALIFGAFCVYGTAFPGPCGDNPGPALAMLESWLVDVPLGLVVSAVGWFVRKGSPRLRRICIVTSFVILSLPIIDTVFFQRRHCP